MFHWKARLTELGFNKSWHVAILFLTVALAVVSLFLVGRLFLSGAFREPTEHEQSSMRMARLAPEGCINCTTYGTGKGMHMLAGSFAAPVDLDPGPQLHKYTALGDTDIVIAVFSAEDELLWWRTLGSRGSDRLGGFFPSDTSLYVIGVFAHQPLIAIGSSIATLDAASTDQVQVVRLDMHGDPLWTKSIAAIMSDSTCRWMWPRIGYWSPK